MSKAGIAASLALGAVVSSAAIAAPRTARRAVLASTPRRTVIPDRALATEAVDAASPLHLGLTLKLTHQGELDALRAAQQDPTSPSFRQWLTPAEFGARFGQAPELVARTRAWLENAGFEVKVYPNQSFIEAVGQAARVKDLFGVELRAFPGLPRSVHVPAAAPVLPSWLAPQLVHVSGLDTRGHAHHRISDSFGDQVMGPQDLRALYDVNPLLAKGFYGQGQQVVYIGAAEAPGNEAHPAGIRWFFQNLSDSTAEFVENIVPNPDSDFDGTTGGDVEDELDAEMQSVGAPGATSIVFDVIPFSQLFTLGPQDVANNFPNAAAVSTSWGSCEPDEQLFAQFGGGDEVTASRQAIIQGTTEGQSWFVATGDEGVDDCQDGSGVSVDFPSDIPEAVAVGGSALYPPNLSFDANTAVTAYEQEYVWNDAEFLGGFGGAGGGGISILFPAPSYQAGVGLDGGRGMPDIVLMAGNPTVTQVGLPAEIYPVDGTSAAAPLSAGFIALAASALGCRLGDLHAALYALGADGGSPASPFRDITVGDNSADGLTGFTAGPGFDLASGWGSLDLARLVAALPACPGSAGDAGPAYSQCAFAGCADAGCVTAPEGPSGCDLQSCDPTEMCTTGTCCQVGQYCRAGGPFSDDGDAGSCAPGCYTNTDCLDGGVCSACEYNTCIPLGNPDAGIGSSCTTYLDCPTDATCLGYTGAFGDAGYCSLSCFPFGNDPCSVCPAGSTCEIFGQEEFNCLATGPCGPGGDGKCPQPGNVCQPQLPYPPTCLPACNIFDAGPVFGVFDSCEQFVGPGYQCDTASGVCKALPCQVTEVDGGPFDTCSVSVPLGGYACEPDAGVCQPIPCTVNPDAGGSRGGFGAGGDSCQTTISVPGFACNVDAGLCQPQGTTPVSVGGTTGSGSSTGGMIGITSTGTTGRETTGGSTTGVARGTSSGSSTGMTTTSGTTGSTSGTTGKASSGATSSGGSASSGSTTGGAQVNPLKPSSGCGCSPSGLPDLAAGLALFALVALRRRKRG